MYEGEKSVPCVDREEKKVAECTKHQGCSENDFSAPQIFSSAAVNV